MPRDCNPERPDWKTNDIQNKVRCNSCENTECHWFALILFDLYPFVRVPTQQATEKWTTVRVGSDTKNKTKIENHLSMHSNLNLNGFGSQSDRTNTAKHIGKEVIYLRLCDFAFDLLLCQSRSLHWWQMKILFKSKCAERANSTICISSVSVENGVATSARLNLARCCGCCRCCCEW